MMKQNRSIIGIAGRKESGKGVVSDVSRKYGYEPLCFAGPLKQLVSSLISVPREELDSLKNVEREYKFHDLDFKFISDETNIPYDVVKNCLNNKTFKTVRELYQVIGTDLIRAYDENWHVNKIRDIILSSTNTKFILNDMRFPNEKAMVEELGGTCWFIVRPKVDNVSNHVSETSLKWQDFDNIIINDMSLHELELKWDLFMSNGYDNSLTARERILYKIHGNDSFISDLVNASNKFTLLDCLFISKHEFTYTARFFEPNITQKPYVVAAYDDLTVLVNYDKNSETEMLVTNPLEIEDLKKSSEICC